MDITTIITAIIGAIATIVAAYITIRVKNKADAKNKREPAKPAKFTRHHDGHIGSDSTVKAGNIIIGDLNSSTSKDIARTHKIDIENGSKINVSGDIIAGDKNNQK